MKYNIFYVAFSSIPSSLPSSLQIIKTCENLSKNNYKVTLVKPATGDKKITISKFYDLKFRVNIKEFSRFKSFPLGLNFYLFCFYSLFYILKKKKSVIITRNYFLAYLLVLFRKKVILEIHHDTNLEGKITKFILNNFNFLNKKKIINIVAITNSVKNLFVKKYKIEQKKITVLPSGSSINIKSQPKLCFNRRLKIGYFGSISSSKGINTLIKLSKIDQENDYYIYGGNRKEILTMKIKNSQKNLFLHHSIMYADLPKKMLSMDILTIPYTKKIKSAGEVDEISKYTSPLKLFDYLAVGKIIVSSDLKVLREVINDKNAYFVANNENIFEWKKNILLAKNNRNKMFLMSKCNLQLSRKYDHTKRVKKYLGLNN